MSLTDELLAMAFFVATLGLPWALGAVAFYVFYWGALLARVCFIVAVLLLALHPMPHFTNHVRHSRLSLALARYFTLELIVDRQDPLLTVLGTKDVESEAYQKFHLPALYLACPHGVFNYGAIVWCCFSRWLVGWEQVTGGASAVAHVPGLRYLAPLIWLIESDRRSIVRALHEPRRERRGGMVGMVPDGILGAFRTRPGHDELTIGSRRGLLRIAKEEGATVIVGWFFGTTDMLTVLQDPFGLMESASRKMKTGFLGYYGRWGTVVPRRVPCSMSLASTKVTKVEEPTSTQLDELHVEVYGKLGSMYERHKAYAGYPKRTLLIR